MMTLQSAIQIKQYISIGYLSVHGSLRLRWRFDPLSPAWIKYICNAKQTTDSQVVIDHSVYPRCSVLMIVRTSSGDYKH